jgi:hypothetical protein
MKKTIYVAGGSKEAAKVAAYIARLEAEGFEITYDWTQEVLKSTKLDHELSLEERQAIARIDLTAVRVASIFWCLLPEQNSIGASIELGAALTYNIFTVVSGPHERSAMTSLATYSFQQHEEAFRFIVELDK